MEIIKLLGIFLLINVFVYLLGSFIAFDMNPLHWSMLTCAPGRVIFLMMESTIFVSVIKD
jgi:hypothetical protein